MPRPPRRSEKQYVTILPDGNRSESKELPCWIDKWSAEKEAARRIVTQPGVVERKEASQLQIEEPELFMSVVVPAYNEEERLGGMLEEAVSYLQDEYGGAHEREGGSGHDKGWEILIVSDGSTDSTADIALQFAKDHQLSQHPNPVPGPWSENPRHPTHIPHGSIRVITLEENRGKGGAVTHGMRHVRGEYVVFADADGASRFEDLGKLVEACKSIEDKLRRGVAIGSRAHLVGSEAVVKVGLHLRLLHQSTSNDHLAIQTSQLPHALLPPAPPCNDTSRNFGHQRHPMRLQALFSKYLTRYHSIHALRRVDFRCRNAHVS